MWKLRHNSHEGDSEGFSDPKGTHHETWPKGNTIIWRRYG